MTLTQAVEALLFSAHKPLNARELMEGGLVKISGRAELPGRPLLYETTLFFLEHFGLRNLDELPNAEELRSRVLPRAQDEAQRQVHASASSAETAAQD